MAATQAENQQNDVNSEKVQSDQHLNVRNSLMQNGTDKSGVRGGGSVVHTKAKNTGGKNIALEMSQYRQDGSGGGSSAVPGQTNTAGSGPPSVGTPGPNSSSESGLGELESSTGATAASTDSSMYSSDGPPAQMQAADGHGYGFSYGRDMHNSAEGGVHAFGPRQPFAGPKQISSHQPLQPHQRFVPGPSISQPSGPTPTLNQLLQSPHPHRYPNSYGHPDQHYNQVWPSQKSLQQGYAPGPPGGQAPGAGGALQRTAGGGGHVLQFIIVYFLLQLSPAYGGGNASSPSYGESRTGWPGPGQHGPGSPGQPNSLAPVSQPSPQPSQTPSHSPGPGSGMPPSPQHQPHQGFPSRPAPPTTPNAHAPDAALALAQQRSRLTSKGYRGMCAALPVHVKPVKCRSLLIETAPCGTAACYSTLHCISLWIHVVFCMGLLGFVLDPVA
ncbi:hypothetical protein NQ317_017519 [Molorchus minor]|uniref:Trithorax group protein osa-like n=1 Tax=Molorchus minor TaxID=1323400 RepID=A0ABQ9JNR1_9CUCU|nr:hypothetical protein NQ317_017519 [Molorchus minor]